MRLPFDWIQLAAAVGAVQGVLLAAVLVAHESKRTANRLLAALMASFTVYLAMTVFYSSGLMRVYPHFFGISYPTTWLFGPLVYLFAVTASDVDRRLHARDLLHFVPVILVVAAALPVYLMSGAEKLALFDRLRARDVPRLILILDPSKYLSGVAYSVATVAFLRQHRHRIEDNYSTTERINLRWLLRLSGAAAAIWVLAVSIRIADILPHDVQRNNDDLVSLAIALLVYAIGYMGLRQPEIHRYDVPPVDHPTERAPHLVEQAESRYERSGLSDVEAAKLKARLLALMAEEHPYRDPDLTLSDLAERLDTTPHKLSQVLNGELVQTFYDFVNSYRVDEVRRRLVDGKSEHLKVLALAMDAGFSSKSTFNEVFKKLTGQTPSTYRKALDRKALAG